MACGYKENEGVQICPAVHLAVAVGRGKSSVQALKWALEMQTETANGTLYLLHVQHPLHMIESPLGYLPFHQANEECQRHAKQQQISATNKILQRYLRMCREKKVNPEVHCVESSSIPEAIVEQIAKLGILKLVIGSSSQFNLIKLFKESKIAFVAQHAPDFCAVMVIRNGKLSTVKNATVSKNVSLITSSKKESVNLISSPRTSCSLPYSSPSTKTCLNFNTGHKEIFPEDNESCVERNKETKKNSLQSLMKERKKIKDLGMALSVAKADAKSLRKELDITKHQAEIDKRSCLEAPTMVETLERNLVREVELRKLAEKRFRKEKKTQSGFVEYSFEELKSATDNFSDNVKLGGGCYGGVYKGILNDVMVAVKVLQKEGKDGEQQFQHEVEVLSSIWHPHIVDLIGVCKEKPCIVYEYMENGSLEDRLSCKNGTAPLAWSVRFKICYEIALALVFLHNLAPNLIVHHDLKPGNILLDESFMTKLSDAGLARWIPKDTTYNLTECKETRIAGSLGYMDPEYMRTGTFGPHSDVFAFGIIILQLLTGNLQPGVVGFAENAINENRLHQILDPSAGEWLLPEAQELANLGVLCTEPSRRNRPSLETYVFPSLKKLYETACSVVEIKPTNGYQNGRIPSSFVCPISQDIMRNPHIAADGFTYESVAIKNWINHHDTSPMTNLKLAHKQLTMDRSLRFKIQSWKQEISSL